MRPRSLNYVTSNKVTLQTGAWLYGVHRTCAQMAAGSRGTSNVTIKQRFGGYSKRRSVVQNRVRQEFSECAGEKSIALHEGEELIH